MATHAEQYATIKTNTLAVIADITASPKPSYSIDGQSISWGEYLAQLQATVEWCDKQIAGNEPFEILSQGYTDGL